MEEKIIALETVRGEYEKLKEKYQKKAVREREKINDVYITVCGTKCYTEDDINELYEADFMSCVQSDNYIERLEKKKEAAGKMKDKLTKSELICKILTNDIADLNSEIFELKNSNL